MKYIKRLLLVGLMICLTACASGDQPLETSERATDSETAISAVSAVPTAYLDFFENLLAKPVSELMKNYFVDYKDAPGAFAVSAALADLDDDGLPEVLMAYNSDLPGAEAESYTQIYQLESGQLKAWGGKLPLTIRYFAPNQLAGTVHQLRAKELTGSVVEYAYKPELRQIGSIPFQAVVADTKPEDEPTLEQYLSLAKTQAVATDDAELYIADPTPKRPGLVIFNTKTYPAGKLQSLVEAQQYRYIHWKPFHADFLKQLEHYYAQAIHATQPESYPEHAQIDARVLAIQHELQSGQTRSFELGDNQYHYRPGLQMRGMQQFELLKMQTPESEIYFDYERPILVHQAGVTYYPDAAEPERFMSWDQQAQVELAQHMLSQALLLDRYADASLKSEDGQETDESESEE